MNRLALTLSAIAITLVAASQRSAESRTLAATPAESSLVQVTTDNVPGSIYSLSLNLDARGAVSQIVYRRDGAVLKTFGLSEARSGVVLMKEGPVNVISIKTDNGFDPSTGGKLSMKILREFSVLRGSKSKILPLQIRKEGSKFTLFSDLPDGLKAFDVLYMEALRDEDPKATSLELGTGDPSEDAVGIKIIQLKRAGRLVDTINTSELH